MVKSRQTVVPTATVAEHVDLNHVYAFAAVVDTGSFTAAALRLGLPKSSVSRAVSKLERDLGLTLLQRTTRKLALTEAGRTYLGRAREALGLLAEAHATAREALDDPSGTVRLTAPNDPDGSLLASALASFVAVYPRIRVEVIFTQRRVDLVEEEVDLAVRAGKLDDQSLVGRKVGTTPMYLVASSSYLAARGTPRRLAQLASHECILHRGVGGSQRWTLSGKRGEESVVVRGALSVDEFPFVVPLSLAGAGIALAPANLAHAALQTGELVRVLPSYEVAGTSVYVVYPAARRLPRRVTLLRDHLYTCLTRALAACGS